MKILDVVLEEVKTINSSSDLAKAFSPGQWFNIIAHFAAEGGKPITNSKFDIVNYAIGGKMGNIVSPSEWNRKAVLYKMSTENTNDSWTDIYNHLKPFADKAAPKASEEKPKPRPLALPTGETFEVFQTWARGAESFTDRTELRNYIVSLSKAISVKRGPTFDRFLNAKGSNNSSNPYYEDFKKMIEELLGSVSASKPISKNDVDSKIYAWLNTVDYALKNTREQQPQNQ